MKTEIESLSECVDVGDECLEFHGYKKSFIKTIITWSFIILTLGFLRLLFHWKPTWMLNVTHKKCPLQVAEKVLIVEQYRKKYKLCYVKCVKVIKAEDILDNKYATFSTGGTEPMIDIGRGQTVNLSVHFGGGAFKALQVLRLFHFKKLAYIWNEDLGEFCKLEGLDCQVNVTTLHQQKGLTQQEQLSRYLVFGRNAIVVPVQSILTLLFLEVLNPFYIFQFFSFCLWFADDYMYYAIAIITMSAFGVVMSIVQTRKNQSNLRSTVHSSDVVTVLRGSENYMEKISTEYLVPGDVIVIPSSDYNMNCDAVLLTGNCIVNESMLTGESVPVTKTPLPNIPNALYDNKEHAKHTLFCGTNVIQTRYFGHENVLAVVTKTGFSTSKGGLVKSIMYPAPVDFKFERDSYRFIILLGCVAMIGFIYTFVTKLLRGISYRDLVFEALDLITIVVPPALPAAMTVGYFYAQKRLKNANIFCISPRSINVTGAVDCVCFDKTGTLTEDGLDMWGVSRIMNGKFIPPEKEIQNIMHDEFIFGMATCHSLTIIDKRLSGDPIDLKMFEATGWHLEEPEVDDNSKFDMMFPTIVKPPECKNSDKLQNPDCEDLTLGIVRQFPFSSNLQRMSVIMRKLGDTQYYVYCKGSPEMIVSLCLPNTVPEDFSSTLEGYTQEGYRVLALSYKGLPKVNYVKAQRISREEVESSLIFLGLVILENRLKPQTSGVIKMLKNANIRVIMITGDNLLTAVSVARDCGIVDMAMRVIIVHGTNEPPKMFFTNVNTKYVQFASPRCETGNFPNSDSISSGVSLDASINSNGSIVGAANYVFAMTGLSWSIIRTYFPEVIPKILVRGAVFARTSPEHKQQIVNELQGLGYYIAMCGDGANDCGALKAAHAGISLSDTESSVASPFTSKEQNISCVPRIIQEGRAALVTSFGIFKYMALYSLTQFISVMILYSIDSNLTDLEYLYIDLFIITTFAFFFGRNEAFDGPLYKQAPPLSLISFSPVFSLLVHTASVILFQGTAFHAIQETPWFVPFNSTIRDEDKTSVGCYENYAIFAVSSFQYITLAFIFAKGAPYRKGMHTNVGFTISVIVLVILTVYLIVYPFEWIRDQFMLILPPSIDFRWYMVLLASINFLLSAFLEFVVVDYLIMRKLRFRFHNVQKSRRKYLEIEKCLKCNDSWPPITKKLLCDSVSSVKTPKHKTSITVTKIACNIKDSNNSKAHTSGEIMEVTLNPATYLEQQSVSKSLQILN